LGARAPRVEKKWGDLQEKVVSAPPGRGRVIFRKLGRSGGWEWLIWYL